MPGCAYPVPQGIDRILGLEGRHERLTPRRLEGVYNPPPPPTHPSSVVRRTAARRPPLRQGMPMRLRSPLMLLLLSLLAACSRPGAPAAGDALLADWTAALGSGDRARI